MRELEEIKAAIKRIEDAENRVASIRHKAELAKQEANSLMVTQSNSWSNPAPEITKMQKQALEYVKAQVLLEIKQEEQQALLNLQNVIQNERADLINVAARTVVALGGKKYE